MCLNELKNIKCIVSDLDGTLLNDEKELDTEIIPVIQRLQEKGILFTAASGRNVHIMKNLIKEMNIQIPYICNNGAEIYLNNRCIYQQNISETDKQKVISLLIKKEVSFLAYANDILYCFNKNEGLTAFSKRLNGCCKIIDIACEDEADRTISKIVCIPKDDQEGRALATEVNTLSKALFCTQSENEIYTITSKKATKGEALQYLLSDLGISTKNVLVFGDNYNDISMFQSVRFSVAMYNASDYVKSQADFITISNNQNGVSYFIKKYLF